MSSQNQILLRQLGLMLWLCIGSAGAFGQASRLTLSGTIRDVRNGESLTGVTVIARNPQTSVGIITNAYGFYSLSLPPARLRQPLAILDLLPKQFRLRYRLLRK